MGFELDTSYKDVAARFADLKAKHPDASLQPVNPAEPYRIEVIDGRFFIVYTAAAYRSPDDARPGIGVAWEPFPGRTPYTKDSELQNAETSAWGRAIIAALASESKHIASAEEVRNRQADRDAGEPKWVGPTPEEVEAFQEIRRRLSEHGEGELRAWFVNGRRPPIDKSSAEQVAAATAEARRLLDQVEAGETREESPSAAGPATAAPAPSSFGQAVIDSRAIGIRAPKVFEKIIDHYPDRKKTWVNDCLRHALAFVASAGKAAATTHLDGPQLMDVWSRLNDLEAGAASLSFSADPAHGCEFTWADGTSSSVLWSDLAIAEFESAK